MPHPTPPPPGGSGGHAVALALRTAACTGAPAPAAPTTTRTPRRTITFWHGWSAPNEVAAIKANIDAFEEKHPNINVKAVGNINDDKINQALRAGGPNAPDVVSSFTTDNVGEFCTSHVFADLTPFLEKSGIDPDTTFPQALLDYTQYEGNQCTLPLLSDAYGLYYNKDAFEAAGITRAAEDAVRVRRRRGQADQDQRRLLLPARLHAELPRLRVDDHATSRRSGTRRTSTPTASPTSADRPGARRDARPGRRTWSTRSAATPSWRSTAPPSVTSAAPRTRS